jgi:hypothetical protein
MTKIEQRIAMAAQGASSLPTCGNCHETQTKPAASINQKGGSRYHPNNHAHTTPIAKPVIVAVLNQRRLANSRPLPSGAIGLAKTQRALGGASLTPASVAETAETVELVLVTAVHSLEADTSCHQSLAANSQVN